MSAPPRSVTRLETAEGIRLSTPSPRGPEGRPDVVPGAVGLGCMLFGLLSWGLFGLAPAALFLVGGVVGGALHLWRNTSEDRPVTLVMGTEALTLSPDDAPRTLPYGELVDAQAIGIDLVLFGHGHVEVARVGWAGPGAARWIAKQVSAELEARRPGR